MFRTEFFTNTANEKMVNVFIDGVQYPSTQVINIRGVDMYKLPNPFKPAEMISPYQKCPWDAIQALRTGFADVFQGAIDNLSLYRVMDDSLRDQMRAESIQWFEGIEADDIVYVVMYTVNGDRVFLKDDHRSLGNILEAALFTNHEEAVKSAPCIRHHFPTVTQFFKSSITDCSTEMKEALGQS